MNLTEITDLVCDAAGGVVESRGLGAVGPAEMSPGDVPFTGSAHPDDGRARFVITAVDGSQWAVEVTRAWPDIVCATCGDYVYLATDQAPESMRGVWSDSTGDRRCVDAGNGPHTPVIADGFPFAGSPPPSPPY